LKTEIHTDNQLREIPEIPFEIEHAVCHRTESVKMHPPKNSSVPKNDAGDGNCDSGRDRTLFLIETKLDWSAPLL
jgi:hypothetical protein